MLTGKVKFWNEDRGFGFIEPDIGGADIFVHISNCAGAVEKLEKGQRVSFEERADRRNGKPEACDVKML